MDSRFAGRRYILPAQMRRRNAGNSAGRVLDAFLDRERASEINTQSLTQGVMKLIPSGKSA